MPRGVEDAVAEQREVQVELALLVADLELKSDRSA